MGQEISTDTFTAQDFERFRAQLHHETEQLECWFQLSLEQDPQSNSLLTGGFELEAWLLDQDFQPASLNKPFLEQLDSPFVCEELAQFNIELNTRPRHLQGNCLRMMQSELEQTWQGCCGVAEQLGAKMLAIGMLPTLTPDHLTLTNISDRARYRALNQQLLSLCRNRHFHIHIDGESPLHTEPDNILIEAATTSFQIHLQVPPHLATRYFNAAQIIAAPLVALTANSPFLFGHYRWAETRIPLFEQIMTFDVGKGERQISQSEQRVLFGDEYVQSSLMECFWENYSNFSVLLPEQLSSDPQQFNHLRLHNGTIWRWNRPLIGFNDDGTPHLRIEHRVIPAAPSFTDAIANTAFYYGLVQSLATQETPPETQLDFAQARSNFYKAARYGLPATSTWLDGTERSFQSLCLDVLLPLAQKGLQALNLDSGDIDHYLQVINARASTGKTGSNWQRTFLKRHPSADMHHLTAAYHQNQISGTPVHEWDH